MMAMLPIDGSCCVLLADASMCRRAVVYTCTHWHGLCASHAGEATLLAMPQCPICQESMRRFSPLDPVVLGGKRLTDGVFRSVSGFFHDVATAWLPEIQEPIPEKSGKSRMRDDDS